MHIHWDLCIKELNIRFYYMAGDIILHTHNTEDIASLSELISQHSNENATIILKTWMSGNYKKFADCVLMKEIYKYRILSSRWWFYELNYTTWTNWPVEFIALELLLELFIKWNYKTFSCNFIESICVAYRCRSNKFIDSRENEYFFRKVQHIYYMCYVLWWWIRNVNHHTLTFIEILLWNAIEMRKKNSRFRETKKQKIDWWCQLDCMNES